MDAVVYLRVSTLDQARHGVSLGTPDDAGFQEARCRELCQRRGWPVLGVFRDAASGRKRGGRPQFDEALKLVCERKAVLVVYALSRASRSVRDIQNMAYDLQAAGAQIASATEEIDTTSAMGKAFFGLLALFAQLESDMIGERIRAANVHTIAKVGHRTQGRAPYGWRWDKRRRMRVEDAAEQEAMEHVRVGRSSGIGWEEIARFLNVRDIMPPKGDRWSRATAFAVYKRWVETKGELCETT